MNQPYARVNQPYTTRTLASALREMFGVQLYKNNARALLSRILSILNLDWLQHACSVRGVYEYKLYQNDQNPPVWIVSEMTAISNHHAGCNENYTFMYWFLLAQSVRSWTMNHFQLVESIIVHVRVQPRSRVWENCIFYEGANCAS